MHAQIGMAIQRAQLRDRPGIAQGRVRVHLGRGAADGALDDPHAGAADGELAADPAELAPGQAGEQDVGAEPPLVPRGAGGNLIGGQGRQVEQADHRLPLIAEHVAGNVVQHGRAPRFLPQEGGEELAHARAAIRVGQARRLLPPIIGVHLQPARRRVEAGVQPGDAGISHQAHEMPLLQELGRRRVERRIALGEGEGAVPWQRSTDLDVGGVEGLRAQPFDRVVVEFLDMHGDRSPCWVGPLRWAVVLTNYQ